MSEEADVRPVRVLVVDDEERNRRLVEAMLASAGCVCEGAVDGLDALEKAASIDPDVVLLDVMMPRLDGYETARRLRADPATADVPIVMVTSLREVEDRVAALEAGADDFLTKPIEATELRARVSSLARVKRMRDTERSHLARIESLASRLEVSNRFIRETFGRYLSDEVVETLLATPDGLRLGGEKRKVTLLMCDLRGFSGLAEELAPEEVVRLVNNYLGTMGDVVLAHGGTIDEYLGDSVLAFFGAPVAREDDARRALRCALGMQCAMDEVNWRNGLEGLPEVESGIAVHTGHVIIGNIGSERRAKYGAVGSHVNLTARIEGHTVGGQVLASEAALHEAGPGFRTGETLSVRAKGVSTPVRVLEVLGLEGADELELVRETRPFVALDPPLGVTFSILLGKTIGAEEERGELVRLAPGAAELRAVPLPAPYSELSIRVEGTPGEGYAKVLAAGAETEGAVKIRFSYLSPALTRLLTSLRTPPRE